MNLAECYRVLGLKAGASFEQIKASYRRLARQYHPDVNPGDYRAKEKFIEVTAAYKFLLANVTDSAASAPVPPPASPTKPPTSPTKPSTSPAKTVIHKTNPQSQRPRTHSSATVDLNHLSPIEQQLKTSSYEQLQQFLKTRRFPRAIALVEGLAQRLPHDPEVVQWQAIVYQQCGRHLIQEHQLDKARLYLKKALRTDPHNRSLWAEVEKDFRSLEQLF